MKNSTEMSQQALQWGSTVQELVLQPLKSFWVVTVQVLPSIATALLVLGLMYIMARIARRVLTKILSLSRLDGMV